MNLPRLNYKFQEVDLRDYKLNIPDYKLNNNNNLTTTSNNLTATSNNLTTTSNNLNATSNNLNATSSNLTATSNNLTATSNNLTATSNNLTATSFSLNITKIYDQSNLGSCVSNAIASCINYYNPNINSSRLYIYFNARANSSQDIIDDTGISVRDGCKSIYNYSVCNENMWPYNITQFSIMPTINCYVNTFKFNNLKYLSVNQDINSIKYALTSNNPIIFGINVYSSFLTQSVANTGIVPLPNTNTEILQGGHCVLMCGFNDTTKQIKCANSWGTKWGSNGFFYLPYSYILNPNLANDFWIINFTTPVTNIPVKTTPIKLASKLYAKLINVDKSSNVSIFNNNSPQKLSNVKLANNIKLITKFTFTPLLTNTPNLLTNNNQVQQLSNVKPTNIIKSIITYKLNPPIVNNINIVNINNNTYPIKVTNPIFLFK